MFDEQSIVKTIEELNANYEELVQKKTMLNLFITNTLNKVNAATTPNNGVKPDIRDASMARNSINKTFSDLVMASSTIDSNLINIKKTIANLQFKMLEMKQKNKDVDEGEMNEIVNRTLKKIMQNKKLLEEIMGDEAA